MSILIVMNRCHFIQWEIVNPVFVVNILIVQFEGMRDGALRILQFQLLYFKKLFVEENFNPYI